MEASGTQEPVSWWESTQAQIIALAAGVFAMLIGIEVLRGVEEKNRGSCPGKNYSYLQDYTKMNTTIFLITNIYFTALAWKIRTQHPEEKSYGWLLAASELALGAAAIRLWESFKAQPTELDLEGEIEQ